MSSARATLWLVLCSACSADLPSTPPRGDLGAADTGSLWARLEIEPDSPPDAVPAVVRFRVTGSTEYVPEPGDLTLFQDELSAYYLRRLAAGELPASLAERLVPSVNWLEQDSVVLAPSTMLTASRRYSLVSRRLGLLSLLGIAAEAMPLGRRLWPPRDTTSSSAVSLFCSADWLALPAEELVTLPPEGIGGRLVSSTFSSVGEVCVRLELADTVEAGSLALPPRELWGVALEPGSLVHEPSAATVPLECEAAQIRFGPGCATLQDDRLVVRNQALRTLWGVRGAGIERLFDVAPSAEFSLLGLTPGQAHELVLGSLDVSGAETEAAVRFTTLAPLPHVVINEVLADALGAEPEQEWVELYNDGSTAMSLGDLRLEDSGQAVPLPAFTLEPGAYVLLVHEAYREAGGADVAPTNGTPLLRLPALGKGGLSNAGESLVLRGADGGALSHFPALPKPKAGVSVARRTPSTADGDPEGFGWHAAPGASPGAANQLP